MYSMRLKSEMLTSRYCSRAPVRLGRRYSPSVICAACCKKAESFVPTIQVSITTPCLCACKTAVVINNIRDSAADDDNDNDTNNGSDNNAKNKCRNENKNNADRNVCTNHSDDNAFWLRHMLGNPCPFAAASLYNLSIRHQAVHLVTQHDKAFGRREWLWHECH